PLYGHPWLLAKGLELGAPAPWLKNGAVETEAPPAPVDFLSPIVLRRIAGVPPVTPFLPRVLSRTALAYLLRGRPAEAARFAREALALDPSDARASEILKRVGGSP